MLALLLAVLAQDPQELVDRLRSDQVDVREAAEKALRGLGAKAVPALEKALKDPDPEVAGRAKSLLRTIGIAEQLSPALREAIPGLVDRLLLGDQPDWHAAYREALEELRRKGSTLQETDVRCLFLPAYRAATDYQARSVILNLTATWKIRSAAPDVTPLLKDPDDKIRRAAVEALSELKVEEAWRDIRPLLKDPSPIVRQTAAYAFAVIGPDDVLPDLRALLTDPAPQARMGAVQALGRRNDQASAGEILRLFEDADPTVRLAALTAIDTLVRKDMTADVVRRLKDPDENVRKLACSTLLRFGAKEAVKDLSPVLEDPESWVRVRAMEAIAGLEGKAARAVVRKRLADVDSDVQFEAFKILYAWDDRESVPQMLRLLKSKDEDDCRIVASQLCWWGVKDGVPVLLERGFPLSPLNGLRRPELAKRLTGQTIALPKPELRGDLLSRVARETGMALEWAEGLTGKEDDWGRQVRPSDERTETARDALQGAVWQTPYEFILEEKSIRIVTHEQAVAFWKGWWAAAKK